MPAPMLVKALWTIPGGSQGEKPMLEAAGSCSEEWESAREGLWAANKAV